MYAKSKLYQTLSLILTLKSLKVKRNIYYRLTEKYFITFNNQTNGLLVTKRTVTQMEMSAGVFGKCREEVLI